MFNKIIKLYPICCQVNDINNPVYLLSLIYTCIKFGICIKNIQGATL